MLRVVIYAGDESCLRSVVPLLRKAVRSRREIPLIQTYSGNLVEYLSFVRGNPYLVMLVITRGENCLDTVRTIRAANPRARMIWFSDEHNAAHSYELHAAYFGTLPVTQEALEESLDACGVLSVCTLLPQLSESRAAE